MQGKCYEKRADRSVPKADAYSEKQAVYKYFIESFGFVHCNYRRKG